MELGLSQKDVGQRVGVAKPTVGAWEVRGVRPEAAVMRKVVAFLGHEPDVATSPQQMVERLRTARLQLRLPWSELAERIGVSYSTVWSWETGARRPRGRSWVLLRKFLAMSV